MPKTEERNKPTKYEDLDLHPSLTFGLVDEVRVHWLGQTLPSRIHNLSKKSKGLDQKVYINIKKIILQKY